MGEENRGKTFQLISSATSIKSRDFTPSSSFTKQAFWSYQLIWKSKGKKIQSTKMVNIFFIWFIFIYLLIFFPFCRIYLKQSTWHRALLATFKQGFQGKLNEESIEKSDLLIFFSFLSIPQEGIVYPIASLEVKNHAKYGKIVLALLQFPPQTEGGQPGYFYYYLPNAFNRVLMANPELINKAKGELIILAVSEFGSNGQKSNLMPWAYFSFHLSQIRIPLRWWVTNF